MYQTREEAEPWRNLAAGIIFRALEDYWEINHAAAKRSKISLRHEAAKWFRDSPWCQYLLECLDLGDSTSGEQLLAMCSCDYVIDYHYEVDYWYCPVHSGRKTEWFCKNCGEKISRGCTLCKPCETTRRWRNGVYNSR